MRAHLIAIFIGSLAATAFGVEPAKPAIIPAPQKMEVSEGRFQLEPNTPIIVDSASAETGAYLAAKLRASTGYLLPLQTNNEPATEIGSIRFTMSGAKSELGEEGYKLEVGMSNGSDKQSGYVSITAAADAGAFYGVQTLLQLFPPQIFSTNVVENVAWKIPFAVRIEDQPRFKWRGFMLDVSRHFFSKDAVERVLDEMAMHKLNMFHWHLTDDQGWRIEIKKYPKLTEGEGGRRRRNRMGGEYDKFYTQDDVREIVAYAAARHITVVPEIEMPGHAIAALAAYPELSCDGGDYTESAKIGINKGVFCVGKDEVFTFLDDVLLEVFQMFPGKYVHIGGDEVNSAVKNATWGKSAACQARMKAEGLKTLDELQGWFTGRMGKFISEHGKTMIGWSEIAEAPLPANAVVMDWQGGAIQAAASGHNVVMTPTKFCYLDYYQSLDTNAEPPAMDAFLPLERVYSFEPIPAKLAAKFQSHILGAQGNLWTEYVPSFSHVEYMMFPRLCALAEVEWSPKAGRNFDEFKRRLQIHEQRLEALGVNYRRDLSVKIGEWSPAQLSTNAAGTNLEWDVTGKINFLKQNRVVFQYISGPGLVITSVSLLHGDSELVTDVHNGFAARNPTKAVYVLNVPQAIPDARYILRATVIGSGSTGEVMVSSPPAKP